MGMAADSYKYARPYLDGPHDWLSRVDPKSLVEQCRPQLHAVVKESLAKVGEKHFKKTSEYLFTENMLDRTSTQAVDKIKSTSPQLWNERKAIICDPRIGIDNDKMIVKVFTENKELLNRFFLTLGKWEFRFIEHCGAAMGFVCGCVQLIAFNNLNPMGRAIFLPVTGFVLGIASNWAAIMCVFKPCFPHPIKICGWHICDIQGLFLKRQPDVAVLYAKLLCEHFLSFTKVVNYLQTLEEVWPKLKEAYTQHNHRVLQETLGAFSTLAPL